MFRYIILLLLIFPSVEALSCTQPNVEGLIDEGGLIFVGTLVQQNSLPSDEQTTTLAFQIETLFSGSVGDSVILEKTCWMGCEKYVEGSTYFIMAHGEPGSYSLGMCNEPMTLEEGATYLQSAAAYVGQGSQELSTTPEEPVQAPENPTEANDVQPAATGYAYFLGGLLILAIFTLFIIWRRR